MNKTGTSSLTNALYILGFRCLHSAHTVKRLVSNNKGTDQLPLHPLDEEYAAFCDSPINYLFKVLDAAYPRSRFIYTTRDFDAWVVSRVSQFGGTVALHRRKWDDHEKDVFEHFKDRPDDLLVYDLCGGDGWEPLCKFLGVPIPKEDFPWKNKTGRKRRDRIANRLGRS